MLKRVSRYQTPTIVSLNLSSISLNILYSTSCIHRMWRRVSRYRTPTTITTQRQGDHITRNDCYITWLEYGITWFEYHITWYDYYITWQPIHTILLDNLYDFVIITTVLLDTLYDSVIITTVLLHRMFRNVSRAPNTYYYNYTAPGEAQGRNSRNSRNSQIKNTQMMYNYT